MFLIFLIRRGCWRYEGDVEGRNLSELNLGQFCNVMIYFLFDGVLEGADGFHEFAIRYFRKRETFAFSHEFCFAYRRLRKAMGKGRNG